jgi:hypothetical protein
VFVLCFNGVPNKVIITIKIKKRSNDSIIRNRAKQYPNEYPGNVPATNEYPESVPANEHKKGN